MYTCPFKFGENFLKQSSSVFNVGITGCSVVPVQMCKMLYTGGSKANVLVRQLAWESYSSNTCASHFVMHAVVDAIQPPVPNTPYLCAQDKCTFPGAN